MLPLTTITLNRPAVRQTISQRALNVALIGGLLLAMGAGWALTAQPVSVTVDGMTQRVHTHRHTVGALLLDLGVEPGAQVRTTPSAETRTRRGLTVEIERATPLQIVADGGGTTATAWGTTAREALTEAGITLDRYDEVVVNGEPLAQDAPLPKAEMPALPTTYQAGYDWHIARAEPLQVRVYRAIPFTVDEGSLPFTVRTTAQTVGEALRGADITLFLGDIVRPSLGSPVSAGLKVTIERSTPLRVRADGRTVKTRTQGDTVADALSEMNIGLSGDDIIEPGLETPLFDDINIVITRVSEEVEIVEDIVPFETVFRPADDLLIDRQEMREPGAEGITRWRWRVRYEDGEEVGRVMEDNWIAQEPAQRVMVYGTKLERQEATVDGERIFYWRRIRMSASSYSANTAGVSPDVPWYGRTRTGAVMRKGIVAVDPNIIQLNSRVYVPGYGYGDALDTGSAIRARRIDLGYDDDNLVLWSRWVDVYLLWPPPNSGITYVLPNWPPER